MVHSELKNYHQIVSYLDANRSPPESPKKDQKEEEEIKQDQTNEYWNKEAEKFLKYG
jgi:hypothetical protein